MKRRSIDLEISDEEWDREDVDFKPSRVLKLIKPNPSPPPPPSIESFAFRRNHSRESSVDECIEIKDTSEEQEENLEDDDVETDTRRRPRRSRGRRFVVDEESDDEEVCEIRSTGEDELDDLFGIEDDDEDDAEEEEEEKEEENVVGKALQKCAKISAELKKELYGSTVSNSDSYAEIENSNVRIVTQEGIDEACEVKESGFRPILKPYQLVGVNFLLLLYRKRIAGAILADEMGLGKTIQAITYLTLLKHLHKDPGPHLIVCPASLLENWEREFKKWCPSFTVLQYHGAARAAYSKELSSFASSGLPPPFNVILVCYSLFERRSVQQKDDRKILKRWKWSCVLMDEAHALKDKNSYRWKNLMTVAKNANQRLMLTGTPLQNDLHELWSLLEFMMPDLFATGDVDLKKLLGGEDKELITQIKSILGPFILRRLKSDVMQQLVPKIQKVEKVDMERQQGEAYKEAIEEYRAASQARMSKLDGVSNSVLKVLPRRQISNYFFQFRKIANHPLLVRRIYSDADVVRFAKMLYPKGAFGFECTLDRVINEMKSYSDFSIHQLLLSYSGPEEKGVLQNEYAFISAKCQKLAKLLPMLQRDGHRVLIFSQWTSMLDILEWTLDVIGVSFRRLDGSTQVTERQCIVDTFNNDTSIFACLLSTRAGGQGLNLTGADTVIIHDMDFNPQIDRQAEDRCHRIGQTKPVTVYRLVTKETVDEGVYKIAQRKLTLDSAVLKSGMDVDSECEVSEKTMEEILSTLLLG